MNSKYDLLKRVLDNCAVEPETGLGITFLDRVRIFCVTEPVRRKPLLYSSGIVVICSGSKIGHIGDRKYLYDSDHYLVVATPTAIECEIAASASAPMTGLFIDIDRSRLFELVSSISSSESDPWATPGDVSSPVESVEISPEMDDAILRLLKCLQSPVESEVLGGALLDEMLFRVLTGPAGRALYELTQHNGSYARLVKVIHLIHSEYTDDLTVDKMSSIAAMSPSAFHRAFKQLTTESPIQYLKKVRLNRARDLIVNLSERSSAAAAAVGYESTSQFSREFKRYFGVSPSEAASSF